MSDLRSINKDALREEIRQSMEYDGPMFIPRKYLDTDNYAYYLELYDSTQPFKFQRCLRLGYTYVEPSEMPGLTEDMAASNFKYPLVDDQNRVAIKINSRETHYLMKIPKDRWQAIQDIKNEDYNNSLARVKQKLKNTQDGDLEYIGNLTTSRNY